MSERPRLRILHLLVWTTCVAIYLGIERTVGILLGLPLSPLLTFTEGISSGTALAGLLLLWSWHRRGLLAGALYPGEVLLVVLGFVAIFYHVIRTPTVALDVRLGILPSWAYLLVAVALQLAKSLAYFAAQIHIRSWRWRVFFLLLVVLAVLRIPLVFLLTGNWISVCNGVIPLVVFLWIVCKDHHDGIRYPWSHWAGVLAYVWGHGGVLFVSIRFIRFANAILTGT